MTADSVALLVVEDNELDVERIERLLRRLQLDNSLVHALDGQEALSTLRGVPADTGLEQPFIVLLDLNMPRMNGYEFLAELRSDAALCATAVFVLSTSDAVVDIEQTARYDVAGYLTKPISAEELVDVIGSARVERSDLAS